MIAIAIRLLMFTLIFCQCQSQSYILEIDQGKLIGRARYDVNGEIFYSFQSIPYAKPPVGELRFKEPQPADKWDNILDATVDVPSCTQELTLSSEDCLYLNVYTPQFPSESYDTLKNVMVFIHGGSFLGGSAHEDYFGAEFLMPEDIVLVIINYRLGLFGSFNLEDASLGFPGNLHMKDQVLALKWVQSNIARFGGNPDSVTLFGQSAGAASVYYQVLSPLSAGLFHKAIIQSGTATASWSSGHPNSGVLVAEALNISTSDPFEMIQQLQSASREEILLAQSITNAQVGAIIEQETTSGSAFITEDPLTIIRKGTYNHVPIMIGYNNIDGATPGLNLAVESMPGNIQSEFEREDYIDAEVYDFYFNSGYFEHPMTQMITDMAFGYPAYSAIKEHVKTATSPIYFYRFSADTGINIVKVNVPSFANLEGATHTDELGYLFNSTLRNAITVEPGSIEEIASDRFVRIWVNFAKYDNPTPEEDSASFTWLPVTEETFYYAELATYESILDVNPDEKSMAFWDRFYNVENSSN